MQIHRDHFRNFGADVLTTFYDVATFSPEPLRKFALQRVELLAQRWVSKFKTLKDMCDSDEDDAEIGVSLTTNGVSMLDSRKSPQE